MMNLNPRFTADIRHLFKERRISNKPHSFPVSHSTTPALLGGKGSVLFPGQTVSQWGLKEKK
jgi:hypothetical protein